MARRIPTFQGTFLLSSQDPCREPVPVMIDVGGMKKDFWRGPSWRILQ